MTLGTIDLTAWGEGTKQVQVHKIADNKASTLYGTFCKDGSGIWTLTVDGRITMVI
jgi:hypothetical protein